MLSLTISASVLRTSSDAGRRFVNSKPGLAPGFLLSGSAGVDPANSDRE
jgi:hypothetical protein